MLMHAERSKRDRMRFSFLLIANGGIPVRTDSARLGDDLQHRVIVLKAVFWTTSSCFAVIPDVGLPFLFGSEKSSSPYVIFGRT